MIRCSNCHRKISIFNPDSEHIHWLMLSHYFQHELDEGEITEATYESMIDALMSLKPEMKEDNEEENNDPGNI